MVHKFTLKQKIFEWEEPGGAIICQFLYYINGLSMGWLAIITLSNR